MRDVDFLATTVRAWIEVKYPESVAGGWVPPPGMRLEMHPTVYYRLLSDPDGAWPYSKIHAGRPEDLLSDRFGLPVVINSTGLRPGEWRLVTLTTDVHLGGEMLSHE